MKNKILITIFTLLLGSISIGQTTASDCSDSEAGCDAVANGFPISPSGFGLIDEANGPNGSNISWPSPNPQGVNSGCMFSGELNSTWISFTILNDGVMEFTLGGSGGSGYFDWIMWQNTDGMACDDILNNTLAPVSCNWNASSAGFTGMADPNDLPPGANPGNFQPPLNVQAGDQFILCFSNYSGLSGVVVPFNNYGIDSGDPGASDFICSSPTQVLDQVICEGDTATLEILGIPNNITSYSWSPATNIDNPNGGPIVQVWPTDTTIYTVTMVSPDSTWTNDVTVNVVHVITPNAGLDDSLCHSTTSGYQLQPTLSNNGNVTWEYFQGPSGTPGTPNAIFQPNNTTVTPFTLTNYPGLYQYVLHESDVTGVCPDGTDTINIYFSKENHTSTFTNPSCFGGNDGSIQIISDGTLGAVEYSFNGGIEFKPLSDTTGVMAGTYTLISRDIVGCEFTSTVTLVDPPQVILTVGPLPDSTVCENGTATLYASATNGTTFNYHWNQTTDLASTQTINPIADSTVMVFAENDLGCFSDTLPITILVHNPISLVITENDTVCPGFESNLIVEALGGFQGYNYVWTENGVSYNDSDNEINMTPTVQTQYCVTVTDGCETTPQSICSNVIMREVPVPMFVTDTTEGCVPSTIQFSDITTYNQVETQTDSIIWLVDGMVFNDSSFYHAFENVGNFDVKLDIITQYGCRGSMTASEYISIHEIPDATFYVISNPTTIFNTEVDMINNTLGDNNIYQWSFPSGTPASSTAEAPTVTYPEGIAGEYPVQLYVTNEFNCKDSTQDIVHIISDVLIYAPNAFTPDGDQINNVWRVYIDGIDVTDFHLIMFNRWGEIVWESYDPEATWTGKYGSNPAQEGTYVWRLITKDANTDKKYEFRGTVNLLK